MKILLKILLKLIMGALSGFVIETVQKMNTVDLTSEEKRNEAFKEISEKAQVAGKNLWKSMIYLAIESAYNLIKLKE